jgi:hypothetical protein
MNKVVDWPALLPIDPFMRPLSPLQYLESVHALLDDKRYKQMETLANDFRNTSAPQLQRYLLLKSWWATNYVSTMRAGAQKRCRGKVQHFNSDKRRGQKTLWRLQGDLMCAYIRSVL